MDSDPTRDVFVLSTLEFLHSTHQVNHRFKNNLTQQKLSCTLLPYGLVKLYVPFHFPPLPLTIHILHISLPYPKLAPIHLIKSSHAPLLYDLAEKYIPQILFFPPKLSHITLLYGLHKVYIVIPNSYIPSCLSRREKKLIPILLHHK